MKRVLTIAASDPSGGAGIQADLRVFSALGAAGLSAVTALTVQDSRGVVSIWPCPAPLLKAQIETVLADSLPDAIKIGLLPGAEAVAAVVAALAPFHLKNIVLDPVLGSTDGVPFLDSAGQRVLLDRLLPLCDLVTPNIPEAAALLGLPICTLNDQIDAARAMQTMGARAVLLKGGHAAGDPVDVLIDRAGAVHLVGGSRVDTPHTHGTGCFLSSAIAARLARGEGMAAAVVGAREHLTRGLMRPVTVGMGRGYPDPFAAGAPDSRTHQDRLALFPGLYVLTDPHLQRGRTDLDVARAAYDGGAAVVQLRAKAAAASELVESARAMTALALDRGRLFIVNDRVDVAAAAGADGVHLGPGDMHPRDARIVLGPDKLIGASAGTVEEALELAPDVSYLAVGAIFGSTTKLDAGSPVGVDRIAAIRAAAPHLPLTAIGGIGLENIAAVASAGSDSAAVISAALLAPDLTLAVRSLIERFNAGRKP